MPGSWETRAIFIKFSDESFKHGIETCISLQSFLTFFSSQNIFHLFFFKMWIIFKAFTELLQYCFYFMFWCFGARHCGISASPLGIELVSLAMDSQGCSLSYVFLHPLPLPIQVIIISTWATGIGSYLVSLLSLELHLLYDRNRVTF